MQLNKQLFGYDTIRDVLLRKVWLTWGWRDCEAIATAHIQHLFANEEGGHDVDPWPHLVVAHTKLPKFVWAESDESW